MKPYPRQARNDAKRRQWGEYVRLWLRVGRHMGGEQVMTRIRYVNGGVDFDTVPIYRMHTGRKEDA